MNMQLYETDKQHNTPMMERRCLKIQHQRSLTAAQMCQISTDFKKLSYADNGKSITINLADSLMFSPLVERNLE